MAEDDAASGGGDVFSILARGATFDTKRFKKQMNVFVGAKAASGKGDDTEGLKTVSLRKEKGVKRPSNVQAGGKQKLRRKESQLEAMLPGCDVSKMPQVEVVNKFRKRMEMKVSGSDVPWPICKFEDLQDGPGASSSLVKSLLAQGYKEPSPIQMQVISVLADMRDVVGIAPTGSGKTLAFLVPIIMSLEKVDAGKRRVGIKALVVSPTKELAAQTARVFRSVMRAMKSDLTLALLGPTDLKEVKEADILLATPLRLACLVEKDGLDLSHVKFLVLDEADRLFEREKVKRKKIVEGETEKPMEENGNAGVGLSDKKVQGKEKSDAEDVEALEKKQFLTQIDSIIAACINSELVRALFSATFPGHVEALAQNVLQDPVMVTIGKLNSAVETVKQHLTFVGSEKGKLLGLTQLLKGGLKPPILVFVDTKERVKMLRKELLQDGVKADCIHSDQAPQARQAALDNFRMGRTWVLVATDVLGRGIDFLGLKVVVNYDFPKSSMDYIHRIGRTGRAGKSGEAYTLYTEEDACHLRPIANLVKQSGGTVPDWMLRLKKEKWSSKVSYGKVDSLPKVDPISKARKNRKAKRTREKNLRRKHASHSAENQ